MAKTTSSDGLGYRLRTHLRSGLVECGPCEDKYKFCRETDPYATYAYQGYQLRGALAVHDLPPNNSDMD